MSYRTRIVGMREVPPDQLLAHPLNFRDHPAHQTAALRGILEEVGFVQAVIVNVRTGYVIDGHLRIEEALRVGQPTITAIEVDVSPEEERLLLATFDAIGDLAQLRAEVYGQLLEDVSTTNAALMQLLDDTATEAGIVPGGGALDPPADIDPSPANGPTRSQPGDLWLINGAHRLYVGDATDSAAWRALMAGNLAQLLVTDPPYNVAARSSSRDVRDRTYGDGQQIANDNLDDRAFRELLTTAFAQIDRALAPGGAFYVFHPDRYALEFRQTLRDLRWYCPQTIIWAKPHWVFGRGDYHAQHECILYGWRPGAAHHAVTDRRQSTLWQSEAQLQHDEHPTVKPIALLERAIQNSSAPGAIVIDPFAGSGTTIVAAHRTGRLCYAMEIDPRYADVALRRAEAEGLTVERQIAPMVTE